MVFVVKNIIVIFRKIKTVLILISFIHYFLHPEKSILNLSIPLLQGGIVIPGPGLLQSIHDSIYILKIEFIS